jgi:hypothetical protein
MARARAAPVTYAYLGVLVATTLWLVAAGGNAERRIVLGGSTNLTNMEHDAPRVLVESVFLVSPTWLLLWWLIALPVAAAPVERWLGGIRTVAVFAAGNVAGSAVAAAWVWLSIRHGTLPVRAADVTDVGASYGFVALLAAFTARLPPRLGRAYAAAIVLFVCGALFFDGEFSDVGHAAAIVVGFAALPLAGLRRPIAVSSPSSRGTRRAAPARPRR